MGRKVNPKIFRIPYNREWDSKWFANKCQFKNFLKQDIEIRKYLKTKLKNCGISKINLERLATVLRLTIHTAKPGLIIGRGGVDIENLKKSLKEKFLDEKLNLEINVMEEKEPLISPAVILESAIMDLEKRIPFRRIMKKIIKQVKASKAEGVKVVLNGRLGGAEIARSEKLIWGKLPLHTLRADIDYSRGVAATIYGTIGVKVWVYRGERFKDNEKKTLDQVNLKDSNK